MKLKRLFSILLALALLPLCVTPASALVNGIFLGSDENGVNILNDTLRPGEEYWFPVLVAMDAVSPTQMTSEDLNHSRLEVRVVTGGKAIASVKVEEKNRLVYLCVIPGSKGTVEELKATIRVNYQSRRSRDNLTITPALTVGYTPLPEGVVEALPMGEFLEIPPETPLLSSKQMNALASQNDYRDVTLMGRGWRYTVNTTKLGKRNLVIDHHPAVELTQQFPDYRLHFIGFPGEPDFTVKGKLWLDVSEIAEEYHHDFYLYRFAYGKLYPLTYEYDKDAGEIMLRPSQLSSYVISDKKIPLSGNTPKPTAESGSGSSTGNSGSDEEEVLPPQQNPDTGEGGNFPAALTAMASLAGLGVLAAKRRK